MAINLAEPCMHRLLHQLSWIVTEPIELCVVIDRDNDKELPLTKAQLSTVILTSEPCAACGCCPPIKLVLQIHRYGSAQATLELKGPTANVGQILKPIHKFYNLKRLTRSDFNTITSMEPYGDGYREDVLQARSDGKGSDARWRHMMGNRVFFEGLRKEAPNTYTLLLGS